MIILSDLVSILSANGNCPPGCDGNCGCQGKCGCKGGCGS